MPVIKLIADLIIVAIVKYTASNFVPMRTLFDIYSVCQNNPNVKGIANHNNNPTPDITNTYIIEMESLMIKAVMNNNNPMMISHTINGVKLNVLLDLIIFIDLPFSLVSFLRLRQRSADWTQRLQYCWPEVASEIRNIGDCEAEQKYLDVVKIQEELTKFNTLKDDAAKDFNLRMLIRSLIFSRFLKYEEKCYESISNQ